MAFSLLARKEARMSAQKLSITLAVSIILFLNLINSVDAQFGRRKKEIEAERAAAEAEAAAAEEEERLSKLVVIGGIEIPKMVFYGITIILAGILSVLLKNSAEAPDSPAEGKPKRGNNPDASGTVDVVIVGCGLPKKGMGWYHLTQLLEMKNVNVRAVVEPFFMNDQLCKDVPKSFQDLVSTVGAQGVEFTKSVADLPKFEKTTMCLIAGRTHDNPKLFEACVENGAKVIFLEKPGAPSVRELESMKALGESKGTKVYLGYNKNVTPYVQKALELSKTVKNSEVFFCHNNSYTSKDLPEVFTRNPEGMLKNMAIHELALLVTFFDVTVDKIETFKVNTSKLFSEKLTIWKPGTSMPKPEYITDFSRVAFKITTKAGVNVSVMADRCGGNVSFAAVKDSKGQEVGKFEFPDAETSAKVEKAVKEDPDMMPYFFVQSDDYLELKNRVVKATLDGKVAEGIATIEIAIEALKLAEYGTDQLNKALSTPPSKADNGDKTKTTTTTTATTTPTTPTTTTTTPAKTSTTTTTPATTSTTTSAPAKTSTATTTTTATTASKTSTTTKTPAKTSTTTKTPAKTSTKTKGKK